MNHTIRARRGPFAGTRIIPLPGGYYIRHGWEQDGRPIAIACAPRALAQVCEGVDAVEQAGRVVEGWRGQLVEPAAVRSAG